MKRVLEWGVRGAAVLALVAAIVAAVVLYPDSSFAQTNGEETTAVIQPLGLGRHGGMGGWFGFGVRSRDDSPLAEALGITVDELNAAREKVFNDRLAQAVADGAITQEEADAILAHRTLRFFMGERLQSAYTEGIAAAVEAGLITQEQADEYLNGGFGLFGYKGDMGRGMMGRGMMGRGMMGRGMMGDRHMGGMMNRGMWNDEESAPGRGLFRMPGRQTAP